jgi:spectinomycin phosphotransferase
VETREVADALLERYGLVAVSIDPVAGGQDDEAQVYRVETRDPVARYLVKVRPASATSDVSAAVTRYLHDQGARHVVAPLQPRSGSVASAHARLSLNVWPFLDGRTGVDAGLSNVPRRGNSAQRTHWRELGAFARRLHAIVPPPRLAGLLARETFRPAEIDLARQIDTDLTKCTLSTEPAREVAARWRTRRDTILTLADRTEELGEHLARRGLPLVLCHADLHTWNVLIDASGEVWVVDWDGAALAPKERDLMFVAGGISAELVTPQTTEAFFEGYGETTVDALALAYYRHAWAIQDIAGYAERTLRGYEPEEAARIFAGLFEPGEIVAIALTSL